MSVASRRAPSTTSSLRRLGVGLVGAALVASAAVAGTGPATAAPLAADTIQLPPIPYDSELAQAVKVLRSVGADKIALKAAETVKNAVGQISAEDVANGLSALSSEGAPLLAAKPVADADPLALLRTLGVQPFTPSVAPFCAAPTADNPLGLVTAGAGAVAGPWPLKQDPMSQLPPWLSSIPGVKLPEKLNLVDKGETAYAFVPATATTGGAMQVAWFNTSTLRGGFADLEPIADKNLLRLLPMLSGVRLAPVKTDSGTILSAVYGTARNEGRTCYFLPAIGVVEA
ncbi:hypothetical protein GCM10009624_13040 [Gordonia sinesedis]